MYEPLAADMGKLCFPITAMVGEKLAFRCPSISDFNITRQMIEWYKVRGVIRPRCDGFTAGDVSL